MLRQEIFSIHKNDMKERNEWIQFENVVRVFKLDKELARLICLKSELKRLKEYGRSEAQLLVGRPTYLKKEKTNYWCC
jgi:hypothetical protein